MQLSSMRMRTKTMTSLMPDLPTQDDEDAVTALLTNMNANLASTKSAAKKSDSNEEELLTVRVLKPKDM